MRGKRTVRGSSIVEFTLVGIPLIFVLISTFEMARGMWIYHSLAHAVKEGTRYAIVHGRSCANPPNDCAVPLSETARRIRQAAPAFVPEDLWLTFRAADGAEVTCNLEECLANGEMWPPAGSNRPGMDVEIAATYPFRSLICMFWPGAGWSSGLGTYNLPAWSRDRIQF
jgi:hypothetical protein